MTTQQAIKADNANVAESEKARRDLAASSAEIVVGLVGYAGSGCTTLAKSLTAALIKENYKVFHIKMSKIIEDNSPAGSIPPVRSDVEHNGHDNLHRARALQNSGDELRKIKTYIVASLAIKEIIELRGNRQYGKEKIAFILDSLKNIGEVELLRDVYGPSFRLIALHCDRDRRFNRLYGEIGTEAKFAGVNKENIEHFMDRDEMDSKRINGQQVRDIFHLADYFIDDNVDEKINIANNPDLKRFFEILLGSRFHRPRPRETAMYTAFATALRSSCLSRQVGAALISKDGQLIAVGSNDVPKFGGGTYLEGASPDNRCAYWQRKRPSGGFFVGCHNTDHKNMIAQEIRQSLRKTIRQELDSYFKKEGKPKDNKILDHIDSVFSDSNQNFPIPKVGDLIEFSRSIHAEMDALFSAGRQGKSTMGTILFCTTFPCHNCARHLVTAGVEMVYYVEPYVKSLAVELHSDSIRTTAVSDNDKATQMQILPFTGVGPRMYEDHFLKKGELKDRFGSFVQPTGVKPISGARLGALEKIEKQAADLAQE